jgi:hypothetical protein
MQTLACSLVAAFVVLHALDSMFRWAFELVGFGAAIYVRDYLLVLAILLTFLGHGARTRDIRRSVWMFWTFAVLVCISFLSELKLLQVLFGIKVWLPVMAGFLLVDSGMVRSLHKPLPWGLLWALLCIGVFLNYFYRFPWIGLTLQVGDLAVTGNREWTAYGVPRLSGFSRSSYDCAMAILVLYAYLVIVSRGLLMKLLIILVSAAAIALTTAKGAAGAFLIAVLLSPLLGLIKSPASLWRPICWFALFSLGLVGLLAPLASFQIPFPQLATGSVEQWLFASMLSRAWETWPQALDLLSGSQLLTGRGLGGIGAAQYIFEIGRENPADNMFVYLYVTGGLIGAGFFVYLLWASRKLALHTQQGRVAFLTLLAVFGYGITANLIENAIVALSLGLVTAWLTAGQVLSASAAPQTGTAPEGGGAKPIGPAGVDDLPHLNARR